MSLTVRVNGEPRELDAAITLTQLLELDGLDRHGPCVVALNEEHVPRPALARRTLSDGDRVEILTVRQGG